MANALFVCRRNAGRSQISQALFERAVEERHGARSAGTAPADRVHPEVVAAMREVGIDLGDRVPSELTADDARWADVVVTMGCGDECPSIPGRRYVDWDLPDPQGQTVEEVRAIREEIERRVLTLVDELDADGATVPVACSLDAAAMAERLASMAALGRAALIEVERPSAGAARLRFRAGEETRASLEAIVAAERACCPFLDLGLAEGGGAIELSVSAPAEGVAVLDGLISAFSVKRSDDLSKFVD